ncbi:amidohydrolase family protein [Streptosporangium carneum]|uniref:Peptidase M38 n=1 Tax=Streptosporangium carneum TaxID=47481 RepID=A0A9W6MFZ1_9ACTN|nr:amidohydrolase family protein [Streptosporangium carneum]GLK13164.1 peptidase M38 [Streptosporangium carneum]
MTLPPQPEVLLRPDRCLLPDGSAWRGQAVLVGADGLIAHVGDPAAVPPVAPGASRVEYDLPGSTLLPGLIDLHLVVLHAGPVGSAPTLVERILRAQRLLDRMIGRGITTVRDTASQHSTALELRALAADGTLRSPSLAVAGSPIGATGRGGAMYGSQEITGADEARRAARLQVRRGVDLLSVAVTNGLAGGGLVNGPAGWQELRLDEVEAVVAEARAAGRAVSANALGLDGIRTAVSAGVDTIEHASELDRRTADLMAERGVTMVPTLTVAHSFVEHGPELGLSPRLVERARRLLDGNQAAVRIAREAGVTIAAGTDSHGEDTVIEEIGHLAAAGLSNREAVLAATTAAGAVLTGDRAAGKVAVGHRGDLLVVDGEVPHDLGALRRPRLVLKNGRVMVDQAAPVMAVAS